MSVSAETDAQAAIIQYGIENGFSLDQINIAVEIGFIESTFDNSATNPASTASGLFQYLDGTWNTYHSGLGSKNSQENQIQAFYEDITKWTGWYTNSATNGNIPSSMSLAEYAYVKHHDGNGYSSYSNAPGLVIYQAHAPLDRGSFVSALTEVFSDMQGWVDENMTGSINIGQTEDWAGSLSLKSGTSESEFSNFLANLSHLAGDIVEFFGENYTELTINEVSELTELLGQVSAYAETAAMAYYDPLVLDLDGDGIETISVAESAAQFDLFEEDGFWTEHGWISGDDGFLALDVNKNGSIDDISELFGDRNTSGFDALKAHDVNGDNKINENDSIFNELIVWRDLDGNGISAESEIFSLSELNISSISLSKDSIQQVDNGNLISDIGSFSYQDGSVGILADVYLTADFG